MHIPNSLQSFVFVRLWGLWCAPEPPPRRHTPATARSSPEDAEVFVHTGSEDYIHRIKTITIILTILAKIAEGKLSKCPLL